MNKGITAVPAINPRSALARLTRAALGVGLLITVGSTPLVNGGVPPQPPASKSFGHTLAQWQAIWLAWELGALAPPTDTYGNALVNGVVLLPIPAATGDGTPASRDITLLTGEPFVVPLALVVGNSFSDGSSSPMVSPNDFKNIRLTSNDEEVECRDGKSTLVLKTCFLKKA